MFNVVNPLFFISSFYLLEILSGSFNITVFNGVQLKSKYIIFSHDFACDTCGYFAVCALPAGRGGEKDYTSNL